MPKKETDISLIQKYLNGELDAKAMHRLERRAQDDPFLMDALDGYGNSRGDHRANLSQIASRLQQRTTPKPRVIIPWRYMAAAASVLIVLTVGGLFLYNRQPANKMQVAALEKSAPTSDTTIKAKQFDAKTDEAATPAPQQKAGALQKAAIGKNDFAKMEPPKIVADKMASASAPIVSDIRSDSIPTVRKNKQVENSVAAVAPEGNAKQTERAIHGRAAGVIVDNSSKASVAVAQPKTIVTGRVIEKDRGVPLSGATINVAGTNLRTHTDNNGYFTIHIDSTKDKLYIANSGYESRQISTRNKDSLKAIKMEPSNSSLSEVVAVGYGTSKKTVDDTTASGAHPNSGWSNFNKYLKKNAVLADGTTGVVKLSFKVAENGTISNIIVVKGLNTIANQKAIDLINNGPAWIGNTNGQTESVVVRIKFNK